MRELWSDGDFEQKNLPSGSTVLFHKPSLWEQHRYLISATAAVVVVQSLIVVGIVVSTAPASTSRRIAQGERRPHDVCRGLRKYRPMAY